MQPVTEPKISPQCIADLAAIGRDMDVVRRTYIPVVRGTGKDNRGIAGGLSASLRRQRKRLGRKAGTYRKKSAAT